MNAVFADSVGLIALWNRRDQAHATATVAYAELRFRRTRLFTTTFVIAECANALSRSSSRSNLSDLVRGMRTYGGLIAPNAAEWEESWVVWSGGNAGSPGLVDLLSFAIMRRLRLERAFTNDSHFALSGFTTLF